MPPPAYNLSDAEKRAAEGASDAHLHEAEEALANGTAPNPDKTRALLEYVRMLGAPSAATEIAETSAFETQAEAEDMREMEAGDFPPGVIEPTPTDLAYVQTGGYQVPGATGAKTKPGKPWDEREKELKTPEPTGEDSVLPSPPYQTPPGKSAVPTWWFDPSPPGIDSDTGSFKAGTKTFTAQGDLDAPERAQSAEGYADAKWQKAYEEASEKGEWLIRWSKIPEDDPNYAALKFAGYGAKAAAGVATGADIASGGLLGTGAQAAATPFLGREGAAQALENVKGVGAQTPSTMLPSAAVGLFHPAGLAQRVGRPVARLPEAAGRVLGPAGRYGLGPAAAGFGAGAAFGAVEQGSEATREAMAGRPQSMATMERVKKAGALGALSAPFGIAAELGIAAHRGMSLNPTIGQPRRMQAAQGPARAKAARDIETEALQLPPTMPEADPAILARNRVNKKLREAGTDLQSRAEALHKDLMSQGTHIARTSRVYERHHLDQLDNFTDEVMTAVKDRREANLKSFKTAEEPILDSPEGQKLITTRPLIQAYMQRMRKARPFHPEDKKLVDQYMPGVGGEAAETARTKWMQAEAHPAELAGEVADAIGKPLTIAQAREQGIRFDPLPEGANADDFLVVVRPVRVNARKLEDFRKSMDKAARHEQFSPDAQNMARELSAVARAMRGGGREGDDAAKWARNLGIEEGAYPTLAAEKRRQAAVIDEEHKLVQSLRLKKELDIDLADVDQRAAVKRVLEETMEKGGISDREAALKKFLFKNPKLNSTYDVIGSTRRAVRTINDEIGVGSLATASPAAMDEAAVKAANKLMGSRAEKLIGYLPQDILLAGRAKQGIEARARFRELTDAANVSIGDTVAGLSKSGAEWQRIGDELLTRVANQMDESGVAAVNSMTKKSPEAEEAWNVYLTVIARESMRKGAPRAMMTANLQGGIHPIVSGGGSMVGRIGYPITGGINRMGAGGAGAAMASTAGLIRDPEVFVNGLKKLVGLFPGVERDTVSNQEAAAP